MNRYLGYAAIITAVIISGCSSVNHTTLAGKWELATINGKAVEKSEEVPYIDIDNEIKSIGGYDGCNNLGGGITIGKQNEITFSNVISTLRLCPEQGDNAMLGKVLESTRKYEISVAERDSIKSLSLFDGNGGNLATFTESN